MAGRHRDQIFWYSGPGVALDQLGPSKMAVKVKSYLTMPCMCNKWFFDTYFEMHLYLGVGVMVPPQADLIVPAAVQVAEAHAVDALLRARAHVRHVDRLAQPPVGGSVEGGAHQRGEVLQHPVEAEVVRRERHGAAAEAVRSLCLLSVPSANSHLSPEFSALLSRWCAEEEYTPYTFDVLSSVSVSLLVYSNIITVSDGFHFDFTIHFDTSQQYKHLNIQHILAPVKM